MQTEADILYIFVYPSMFCGTSERRHKSARHQFSEVSGKMSVKFCSRSLKGSPSAPFNHVGHHKGSRSEPQCQSVAGGPGSPE